jgi:eukaryotic-like serine/threonine-protein kinase
VKSAAEVTMQVERWERIQKLFHSALEHSRSERTSWLRTACPDDEELRREVESLLAAHETGGNMLENPAADLAAEWTLQQRRPAPQMLGHFRLLSLLGKGGMGEVWLAEDTDLDRKVAIKLLPTELTANQKWQRRFEREARAASALNHPNIITIYEIGQKDETHFIAAEFVDGETLRQRISGSAMEWSRALELAVQVAGALSAAHKAGIAHRDLKPENIMVRYDGLVKVLDFGLAKSNAYPVEKSSDRAALESTLTTDPGMIRGTVAYMSPEQARGVNVDVRSDIFSFGVVLYELITSRRPFTGETTSDVIAAILTADPVPLGKWVPGIPAELERIVGRALQKDRSTRYRMIDELREDMNKLQRNPERETPRVASGSRSGPRAISRSRVVVAILILMSLALAGFGLYRRHDRRVAIDSIAILPFINEVSDPDVEYLSDEVPISLINSLSQLKRLRVVPRSTVFRYKGQQLDPRELGQKLGVRALLTGRVTQRGDQLTIQVELVDVERVAQLWGATYNRQLSDILTIQKEIATKITDELQLNLSQAELRQVAKRYTRDPESWRLYLVGRHLGEKGNEQSSWKAIEYFNQAIARDPDFALAYADIAFTYTYLEAMGAISGNEAMIRAKESVTKALAIDHELAEAHVYLGDIKCIYEWDWHGADREYQQALTLNPNSGMAHRSYSLYLVCLKRYDEAIAQMKRALELEPLSSLFNHELGAIYYFSRRYDQTVTQNLKALELDQNNIPAYFYLSKAYTQLRSYDRAIDAGLKVWTRLKPELRDRTVPDLERWKRFVQMRLEGELVNISRKKYVSPYQVAENYTLLGEKEQALIWLGKAMNDRDDYLTFLSVEPIMDGLRDDPRFKNLVRRIGLPE